MDRRLSADSDKRAAVDSSSAGDDRKGDASHRPGVAARLGSALRSATHALHLFQRHQVVAQQSAAAMAGAVGARQRPSRPQSGPFRKLTGAGLLDRFRSASRPASDDEMEGPSARGLGIVSHPANCAKSAPIVFQAPDDAWQRLDQHDGPKVIPVRRRAIAPRTSPVRNGFPFVEDRSRLLRRRRRRSSPRIMARTIYESSRQRVRPCAGKQTIEALGARREPKHATRARSQIKSPGRTHAAGIVDG